MKKLILLLTLTMMFGGEVSQKVIDVTIDSGSSTNLEELFPQFDLEWAVINVIGCPYNDMCFLEYSNTNNNSVSGLIHQSNQHFYSQHINSDFWAEGNKNFIIGLGVSGVETIKLLVTAEFPQEDTGYIEDGFDYCVEPGANLMSYPCDSDVALLDAIPSDALSQFSGIIGQGLASVQLPNGTWVGSLTNMQASSGYWITSTTSLCFNYDCSEN